MDEVKIPQICRSTPHPLYCTSFFILCSPSLLPEKDESHSLLAITILEST